MRRGVTLPELMSVLAIVALVTSVLVPPAARALHRAAVDEAVDRYSALHETTRQLAIGRAGLARLEIDTAQRTVAVSWRGVRSPWDTVETRPLGSATIETSQPAVTFNPIGIGYGASNTRIIFRRGPVAETLTVSRTGRLKRR